MLASSNPGDIVLDPFAGSFITGAIPSSPAGKNSLVLRSTASTSKWGFDGWMSRRITLRKNWRK
ncbi:hypothetical protein ACLK19_21870 [Escherichia coli]